MTKNDQQKKRGVAGVTCPKCGSRLVVSRVPGPVAGADGSEGYFVQCHECGTWLTGTIDPNDDVFVPL
jgi:uncharacterized Zn finger protein